MSKSLWLGQWDILGQKHPVKEYSARIIQQNRGSVSCKILLTVIIPPQSERQHIIHHKIDTPRENVIHLGITLVNVFLIGNDFHLKRETLLRGRGQTVLVETKQDRNSKETIPIQCKKGHDVLTVN